MDCLIWFSELPQVGGRILSCPDFTLICRWDALLGWEASAGDWLFQDEFFRAILERCLVFLNFFVEADPYPVGKGLCE